MKPQSIKIKLNKANKSMVDQTRRNSNSIWKILINMSEKLEELGVGGEEAIATEIRPSRELSLH
jgi:hypothetical protein